MKKKLLSLLLAGAMLLALGAPALAAEEKANYDDQVMLISDQPDGAVAVEGKDVTGTMKGSIVILHSNDVHGAIDGYAKMALLKEMYTLLGADVYVMDAGDFIQGDPTVSASQGVSAVSLMNTVGYDAVAPGNHEFDYGYMNLKKLERSANFPILAANVTYEGALAFGDNRVFETSTGAKLGVFGLDTPETASKAHPSKIAGVKFAGGEELYQVAQDQVDALKAKGADYIVCLGHLGIDEETAATANRSVDLLEKVTGIDVFIDGHSHSTLEDLAEKVGEAYSVNGTLITSTGTKFATIGAVVIDPEGKITLESYQTEHQGEDEEVAAQVQALKDEIETAYGAKFAQTEVRLEGEKAMVRAGETNLGDLIADAMLWYATKDGSLQVEGDKVVAITNGGGIRASIEAGDVTRKDINTVLPFGNTVAVVYVSGKTLLEVLEASTYCAPEPVGAFPQVHGLRFSVNTAVAYDQGAQYGDTTYFAPASIGRVSIQAVNGKSFDEEATYAVVTNDFLAAGGDTYYALTASETIVDTGAALDEVVMAYITDQLGGKITAGEYGQTQGRVTVADGTPLAPAQPMWYDAAVKNVTEKGIMQGTGNGFDPDATVTRATVFQTLYNLEGKPAVSDPDGQLGELNEAAMGVSGHWWTDAARWAYQTGLTQGTGEGFQGDRAISRQELVTILHRYANYRQVGTAMGEEVNLLAGYLDAELVSAWALEPFRWAVGSGAMAGKTTDAGLVLDPASTASRAELAQILTNISDFFLRAAQ